LTSGKVTIKKDKKHKTHQTSQQMNNDQLLPPPMVQTNAPPMYAPNQGPGQDFNQMYEGPNTPLVNAATPGNYAESFEPMAANEGLGGYGGMSF